MTLFSDLILEKAQISERNLGFFIKCKDAFILRIIYEYRQHK